MRLTFWYADKGYETLLGPALMEGAAQHGDEVVMRPIDEYRAPEGDGGIICGVVKREILWEHQLMRAPLLYLDKGYNRRREPWGGRHNMPAYWRLCWNETHPTEYLMKHSRRADRWEAEGSVLFELGRPGNEILLLGSSEKFHETMRLEHPTQYAQQLVDTIRTRTDRHLVYRPKPSWKDAVPVMGADFDQRGDRTIEQALAGAFCSVTYGSIACVDSIFAGVPCIVLGNGVARHISSNYLSAINAPYWAPRGDREQWAANLAYCQFTPDEIAAGVAWGIVKEQMTDAV